MAAGDDTELLGGAEADAALARLAELLVDLRPFWPLVVPIFIRWMSRQFDEEGAYFGERWEPLTDDYLAWKMQHYPNRGILSADGDLRRAATTPRRRAYPQLLILSIPPFTHRTTEHQKGGTIDPAWFQEGTGSMVARPLLSEHIPEEGQQEIALAAELYITENAAKLGLLAG